MLQSRRASHVLGHDTCNLQALRGPPPHFRTARRTLTDRKDIQGSVSAAWALLSGSLLALTPPPPAGPPATFDRPKAAHPAVLQAVAGIVRFKFRSETGRRPSEPVYGQVRIEGDRVRGVSGGELKLKLEAGGERRSFTAGGTVGSAAYISVYGASPETRCSKQLSPNARVGSI